jgi:hypothetical protein
MSSYICGICSFVVIAIEIIVPEHFCFIVIRINLSALFFRFLRKIFCRLPSIDELTY